MEVASELTMRGLPSKPYHAALSAKTRADTQSEWMDGCIAIIVATVSFGMGVDKPDVRSDRSIIMHFEVLKSYSSSYMK